MIFMAQLKVIVESVPKSGILEPLLWLTQLYTQNACFKSSQNHNSIPLAIITRIMYIGTRGGVLWKP
jgi:hypothetical protein